MEQTFRMLEKNWTVELSKAALKYLNRLDKNTSTRLLGALEKLEHIENPLLSNDVRPLTGMLKGFYRLRIGEYRAILELDTKGGRIGVLAIIPRGSAYK